MFLLGEPITNHIRGHTMPRRRTKVGENLHNDLTPLLYDRHNPPVRFKHTLVQFQFDNGGKDATLPRGISLVRDLKRPGARVLPER
jgi:hypothetical protein